MKVPAKTYFATPEEMHTAEYTEYVKWMAEVWRLNDERNRRIEAEKLAIIEKSYTPVSEKMLANAKQLGKDLYPKLKVLEKTR